MTSELCAICNAEPVDPTSYYLPIYEGKVVNTAETNDWAGMMVCDGCFLKNSNKPGYPTTKPAPHFLATLRDNEQTILELRGQVERLEGELARARAVLRGIADLASTYQTCDPEECADCKLLAEIEQRAAAAYQQQAGGVATAGSDDHE